jgi:hypothetical protein
VLGCSQTEEKGMRKDITQVLLCKGATDMYISYVAENSGDIDFHEDVLYLWNDNAQLQVTALAVHMHVVCRLNLGCYTNIL